MKMIRDEALCLCVSFFRGKRERGEFASCPAVLTVAVRSVPVNCSWRDTRTPGNSRSNHSRVGIASLG